MSVKFEWMIKLRDLLIAEPQTFDMRYHSTCAIGFAIDRGILSGVWGKSTVSFTDRFLTSDSHIVVYKEMGLDHVTLQQMFDRFGYSDPSEVPSAFVVDKMNTFLMERDHVQLSKTTCRITL